MAYNEELAIIVRFDGTVAKFDAIADKSFYYNKVVFITGDVTSAQAADRKQAIWVANSSGGKYLNMSDVVTLASELDHITTIYVDNASIDTTGGAKIKFVGADGVGITVAAGTGADADKYIYTFSTQALVGNDNDDVREMDIPTLRGLKNFITQSTQGLKVYVVEGGASDTEQGNFIKSYKIYQDNGVHSETTLIGTINIPKDLVVESGSIVEGQWLNGVFTPVQSGSGKAIKLVIANQQEPIYINVADLVDAYTAEANAVEIQLVISGTNEISATIVPGSISKTHLNDELKQSINKADSAYQKPTTGVPASDLSQEVKNSLGKADNAVATIGIYIPTDDVNYLSGNVGTSGTTRTINLDVKTETIGNATSDDTKKGLATAEDVAAFIKARLSVKVVS